MGLGKPETRFGDVDKEPASTSVVKRYSRRVTRSDVDLIRGRRSTREFQLDSQRHGRQRQRDKGRSSRDIWSASRVELPEYVAEVQHGAFGIFDWMGGNEEDSRGGKEAGRPLPSIECNVGTPATAELSTPCTLPCCILTDTCLSFSTDASQTQRHECLRRRVHCSHAT
jgi:hypothetical protein